MFGNEVVIVNATAILFSLLCISRRSRRARRRLHLNGERDLREQLASESDGEGDDDTRAVIVGLPVERVLRQFSLCAMSSTSVLASRRLRTNSTAYWWLHTFHRPSVAMMTNSSTPNWRAVRDW